MNKLPILTAVFAILVAPAVLAGTPAAPEVTDTPGDAPAALDIVSGWFATGAQTWTTREDRTVTFTWQLADLGFAAPLADEATSDTRYHYDLTFKPSTYGSPITVRCWIHFADTSPVGVYPSTSQMAPGTNCADVYEATTTVLDVSPRFDIDADTFRVTLRTPSGGGISLVPGTVLSGISLKTSGGPVTATLNPLLSGSAQGPVKDTATGTASYTV